MEITLKYSSRYMVYTVILIVASLAATITFIFGPEKPLAYLHGTLFSAVFCVIMVVFFLKEKKRCNKAVVISPKGIKTEDGELLRADTIDHCYLHLCDFFIQGGRGGSIDKSFFRLIVVLKDGGEKCIDLLGYRISFKRVKSLHQEVNAIPGMPLFKEPLIESF